MEIILKGSLEEVKKELVQLYEVLNASSTYPKTDEVKEILIPEVEEKIQEPKKVTKADVIKLGKAYIEKFSKEKMKELFTKYGTDGKITGVPAEKYAELFEEMERELHDNA